MGRGSHPHPGSDAEGSWNSQDPPREVNLGRKGHFWGPVGLKSALTPHKLVFTFKKEDTFPFTVCVCVCVRARVRVCALSQFQLCDPMDCSLPGSSVHGISQPRRLEQAAISFSRGSSKPRD